MALASLRGGWTCGQKGSPKRDDGGDVRVTELLRRAQGWSVIRGGKSRWVQESRLKTTEQASSWA